MNYYDLAGLRIFQFESLHKLKVTQGVFSRRGGVSYPPWNSLNLGSSVGDDLNNVLENKIRLMNSVGYKPTQVAQVHQIHSAKVVVVNQANDPDSKPIKSDAMITDTPGILMLMRFADCVPLIFYDPVKRIGGLAHAGWKGTVKQVAYWTVQKMVEHYGTNPTDLIACIGPSIGPDHYEIGEDVIDEIKATFPDRWEQVLIQEAGSVKLDLWTANEISLKKAGVERIEISKICTACNLDDWFSHRAEDGRTGRFAAVFGLK